MTRARNSLVAALDLGSAKACCLIARVDGDGKLRVIGIGHQVSNGLRGGAVVDMEQAEQTVGAVVHAAEEMAEQTIRSVVINLCAGQPASHSIGIEIALDGHEIDDADLRQVFDEGRAANGHQDRTVLHAVPVGYAIDGQNGIRDPRGMCGERLGTTMHVVTAARGAVRNHTRCVARCHLEIDSFVMSPYAAGLAALVDDEKQLGAVCIDMGAGTTSLAVFHDGEMVHADSVPVGGDHITSDIARGLSTAVKDAERLKTLYGSVLVAPSDRKETIDVRLVGEVEASIPSQVPRAQLIDIVRPRVEETFELVRDRLRAAGVEAIGKGRVVLTGGASQLTGVQDVVGQVLEGHVRIGRPKVLDGLAESMRGPAFSTTVGLLEYAVQQDDAVTLRDRGQLKEPAGRFGRIGHWFRENF